MLHATSRSPSMDGPRSQFTYRDLRRLGNYSPQSPLRVIALVDYDAFYAQCEMVRLNLDASQPLAVQQWNAIIALNYAARGFGFSRGASVEEVRRLCPNIIMQHVATWREGETSWAYRSDAADPAMMKKDKAALDPYRIESRKSINIITKHLPPAPLQRIEKASVDEVFIDLSAHVHSVLVSRYPQLAVDDNVHGSLPLPLQDIVLHWETDNLVDLPTSTDDTHRIDWDEIALNIGAQIIRNLRKEIFESLHYTCSAGIAQNKALAKHGAGFKKPDQQTVIRARAVPFFLSTCKMTSIRGLAGVLGVKAKEAFGSNSILDLLAIPQEEIVAALGRQDGHWFFSSIRGEDRSEVIPRTDPQHWPGVFLDESLRSGPRRAAERPQSRIRVLSPPIHVCCHHHIRGRFGPTTSKQCTILSQMGINEEAIFNFAMKYLKIIADEAAPAWPCLSIGLSLHGLVKEEQRNQLITSFMLATPGRQDSAEQTHKPPVRDQEPAMCTKALALRSAETTVNATADGYSCPTCGNMIAPTDVLEHLDWHVACALQERF
ncbi:sister chromatid cohesion Eso1 protein [Rutstroemia sp. NJR-2017a WRK4]|nr:sister chromatid cohesion Eso1 protein [Rutstroemia sp. NJR-2017a WRK4]